MQSYKTIFISDTHLGSKDCKAELLLDFLKKHTCESLYLVGDILDGWKMQQNKLTWKQSHTNVVKKVLGLSKKGTRVIYVTGNHDEFIRPIIKYGSSFGNITLCNSISHQGMDGKKYLVIHGDLFDGITSIAPWISFLGDRAYDFILSVNNRFNWVRHRLGFGYWSLSKYLKLKVKKAMDFIFKFEMNITDYSKRKGYDGVICGHIHNAEIKEVNDTIYMNTGDWVESCTALVEHHDGKWELITWEAKVKFT